MQIQPLPPESNHFMSQSRTNNFDLARLALALMVVGQHLGDLSGSFVVAGWFRHWSGLFAVQGFFVISGYLIAQSWERSSGPWDYTIKRLRRLYPGYLASVILFGLLCATTSSVPFLQLLGRSETWRFWVANLTFLNFVQDTLPGVFTGRPHAEINGALWTIKIEVMFYAAVPVIMALMRRLNVHLVVGTVFATSIAYKLFFTQLHPSETLAKQLPGQMMYFAVGMWAYGYRETFLKCSPALFFPAAGVFLASHYFLEPVLRPLGVGFLVLLFCLRLPFLGNWSRYGDFSYGVYVSHFPVIQLLVSMGLFSRSPALGVAASVVLIAATSTASWHLVEKRFLRKAAGKTSASDREGPPGN